jgi:hypothetical protein
MKARRHIQVELVKLVGGERLLRLTEIQSGLSLEKKLGPKDAVIRQKQKLLAAFEAVLDNGALIHS